MAEQFYFAWVDEGETFDPEVHNRFDEIVFSFEYEQSEGDFAGIKLAIKNPRIGLLNTGRKVWGILSFNDGTTITPLFRGRLIGVPTNIFDTIVTLEFTARPADYTDQKKTLANTLRVLPYWDPIFISPDSWEDDDTVLEARSELWHIDPVTLVLTTSNILEPEDGTEEFTADQHFYDNMQVTLNQTPARACSMVATIPWTQSDVGGVSLDRRIRDLFAAADTDADPGTIVAKSFTMKGLIDDWPKQGGSFGSGWEVTSGNMLDVTSTIPIKKIEDIFSWQGAIPVVPEGSIVFPLKVTGEYHWGEKAGFNLQFELVIATLGYGIPSLSVNYTAGRELAQIVTFTLLTDQQAIVTLPGEDEAIAVSLSANKVSDPTYDSSIPLVDVRRRNYTHTARGMQSIEHLLLVARANLCSRSRAVEVVIECEFKQALRARSLRKSALVHDPRLPGGQAIGKIIHVELSLDGDQGAATGKITIACCIGYGGSYTTSPGTPTYVDDGYTDDYQQYTGQIVVTDTEDIAWTIPDPVTFDDGIDFIKGLTAQNAVLQASLTNDYLTQKAAVMAVSAAENTDQALVSKALQEHPTQLTFQMVPMEGGPFQQEVVVSVSDLIVPKQIDLEAPSNA